MLRILRDVFLALVLVAAGAAALAYAFDLREKIRPQVETHLGLAALENALLEALSKSQNAANGVFQLKGQTLGRTFDLSLKAEQTLTLDRQFQPCMIYPSDTCGYKIKLSFDQKRTAYSYEVSSAYAEAPLSLRAGGRQAVLKPSTGFANDGLLACDPRRAVAASGYSTSAGLTCIQKPELMCPPGSLPKGLSVTGAIPRLELVCGEASRTARCPANYSLESIDTRTLDNRIKKQGVCVRTTLNSISPREEIEPAPRLSGRVCPFGYRSDSACSFVNITAKPGRCGGKGAAVQPVAGKIEFTQNTTVGFADCAVRKRQQSCGAQWNANVQLKVRCVLDQTERVGVQ
jgi:hypothetical protein